MKSGTITAIVMTFLAITPFEGWTCPLCNLSEGDTILTELDSASTAVLAELVRPPLSADKQNATTGYRIVEVLKGGQWGKAGDTFDLCSCPLCSLRCPSEILELKWSDIDWGKSEVLVRSEKTAHHVGQVSR